MPSVTRRAVQELAEAIKAGGTDPRAAFDLALSSGDAESAAAHAFAAALADRPLPAERVLRVMAALDDGLLIPQLVASSSGDRVTALLEAVEREDMSHEREAAALYLAAVLTGKPAPARLLTLIRTLARRGVDPAWDSGEAALIVAAANAAGDKEALRVVTDAIKGVDPHWAARIAAPVRNALQKPLLEQLPETSSPRVVVTGVTMRREAPKVGRNDPCPCGSGKKYKKCHEGKDLEGPEKPLAQAARTLSAEQVPGLRIHDLVKLDLEGLAVKTRAAVFRRFIDFRRWENAEKALEVMEAKSDPDLLVHRMDFVEEALRGRALEVAQRHVERLVKEDTIDDRLAALITAASPTHESLAVLEEIAEHGLAKDQAALFDVADALLTYQPALGILFARGALTPDRPVESVTFLDLIEEARDRLGLPPNDPAGKVYDAMADIELDKREEREREEASGAKLLKLSAEMQALRMRAKDAGGRIAELEARLREQERQLSAAEAPAAKSKRKAPSASSTSGPAAAAAAAEDEERRRLRARIAELKGLIAEGNDERTDLRRKLAERTDVAPAAPPAPEPEPAEPEDDGAEVEADESLRVRGVMVPRFSRVAEGSLRDFPGRVVRDALRVVAELCSGEASAWREIKQLERVSPAMYSARVGIHYRLLFRPEAGVLDVADVVSRESLIAAIKRYV